VLVDDGISVRIISVRIIRRADGPGAPGSAEGHLRNPSQGAKSMLIDLSKCDRIAEKAAPVVGATPYGKSQCVRKVICKGEGK
jgi:hypothetical protein